LTTPAEHCDVIVIGGGSAAFEAAIAAREHGAEKIVMLEKAPESEYGGNARYSGTGFRFWHSGAEEIRAFLAARSDGIPGTVERLLAGVAEREESRGRSNHRSIDCINRRQRSARIQIQARKIRRDDRAREAAPEAVDKRLESIQAGSVHRPVNERPIRADGVSVILVEHVMKAIMRISNRIVVIHHGEKIADGPPERVVNDPSVIAAYLGARVV